MHQVTRGKWALHSPIRCDRCQRKKHETAPGKLGMGHGQPSSSDPATAPQHDVEIEHPRPPALSWTPTEFPLERLQPDKHLARLERAFDQRNRIGEIAAGTPARGVEDDARGVEQPEVRIEPGDRCLDYAGRSAKPPVRTVRSDGDGIEIGHQRALSSARP